MALFIDTSALAKRHINEPQSDAFDGAIRLIRRNDSPVATLDALHLASAMGHGCEVIVTSDHQLARAAQASGLAVHDFSG